MALIKINLISCNTLGHITATCILNLDVVITSEKAFLEGLKKSFTTKVYKRMPFGELKRDAQLP